MKPGIHRGITFAEYGAWKAASYSALKTLRDGNPAKLRWKLDHPSEPTPQMILGSAVHCFVLEPKEFEKRYAMGPADARTKEGKMRLEELRAAKPGAAIFRPADWETVVGVTLAIKSHARANLLLDGETECSVAWDQDGIMCKARFDAVSVDTKSIVDLKTTRDASPEVFGRSIWGLGYHIQAAHYLRGAEAVGLGMQHYVLLAVETEPPYCIAMYRLQDSAVEAGAIELDRLLGMYSECQNTNFWPGYAPEAQDINIPDWALRRAYLEVPNG